MNIKSATLFILVCISSTCLGESPVNVMKAKIGELLQKYPMAYDMAAELLASSEKVLADNTTRKDIPAQELLVVAVKSALDEAAKPQSGADESGSGGSNITTTTTGRKNTLFATVKVVHEGRALKAKSGDKEDGLAAAFRQVAESVTNSGTVTPVALSKTPDPTPALDAAIQRAKDATENASKEKDAAQRDAAEAKKHYDEAERVILTITDATKNAAAEKSVRNAQTASTEAAKAAAEAKTQFDAATRAVSDAQGAKSAKNVSDAKIAATEAEAAAAKAKTAAQKAGAQRDLAKTAKAEVVDLARASSTSASTSTSPGGGSSPSDAPAKEDKPKEEKPKEEKEKPKEEETLPPPPPPTILAPTTRTGTPSTPKPSSDYSKLVLIISSVVAAVLIVGIGAAWFFFRARA